jgi:hypothetical protein
VDGDVHHRGRAARDDRVLSTRRRDVERDDVPLVDFVGREAGRGLGGAS